MSPPSFGNLIPVGKVIRPHGLEGLLRVWPYARSETSLVDAGTIFLKFRSGKLRKFKVVSVTPHKGILLIRLEGIGSSEAAEDYRGAQVFMDKTDLRREEDEFFWFEILGLRVYLDNGAYLGDVKQIIPAGSNDIYVVHNGSREVLIPATLEVVTGIDLKKGQMTISAMEGLLDPQ